MQFDDAINPGDHVRLVEMPDGVESREQALTIGRIYRVTAIEGSCIWTTSDAPSTEARYWRGRVQRIN